MPLTSTSYFDLSHFSLLRLSGKDAYDFLQAQVCGDLEILDQEGWFLTAWCLPNGRVITTFILYRQDDSLFILIPSMLKDKISNRLGMFVLRSDVRIEDISDDYMTVGLAGEHAESLVRELSNKDTKQQGNLLSNSRFSAICINRPEPRFILIGQMQDCDNVLERITQTAVAGERTEWSLKDIQSGLPWILESTSELFLPQMLNLDNSRGLSYQKGCYPGQEVIARLHFRGQVKKRMVIGHCQTNTTPGPGDRIMLGKEEAKPVGDILDAERDEYNRVVLLAVVEKDVLDSDALVIEKNKGDCISLERIQYPAGG